jgi:hypothetical protein
MAFDDQKGGIPITVLLRRRPEDHPAPRSNRRPGHYAGAVPNAKAWKRARTLRRDLAHFRRYRRREYDIYHAAARAVAAKTADQRQIAMVQGLEGEINASKVRLPVGQTVFHGRADRKLTGPGPYPAFVSTSLHPIVALNHAFKRAGVKKNRPVVYVLTARVEVPTIWGHAGNTCEWELVLPPRLFVEQTSATTSGEFDIIEAAIVGRGYA